MSEQIVEVEGIGKKSILSQFVDPLWVSRKRYIVLSGGAGSGKAIEVNQSVLIPGGSKPMKDICVGDSVISASGFPSKVIHKIDVGTVPTYEIEFEDGRSCLCSGDHLWEYAVCSSCKIPHYPLWKIGTTENLLSAMSTSKVIIPLTSPVRTVRSSDMRSDPYTVGCSGSDDEKLDCFNHGGLEDRWNLLRGIFDSSAVVDRVFSCVKCSYHSSNDKSIICTLVQCLGGICTCNGNYIACEFRGCAIPVFRAGDKIREYQRYCLKSVGHAMEIRRITPVGDKHCQCIAIDDPSELFLVNDYIVTHNSHATAERVSTLFLTQHNCEFGVIRGTSPALTKTAYRGTDGIIESLKRMGIDTLSNGWLNKTDKILTNPLNNNIVYFIGVDDPEKIKSLSLNYVWAEEATELNPDKFDQLNMRLRKYVPGVTNQFFLTYNPISYNNWAVQQFQINPTPYFKENTYLSFSTFFQNPYIKIEAARAMLEKAKHNRNYYYTYILGQPGKPLGQVYPNIMQSASSTWPDEVNYIEPYYGVDWGYVDPMVLIECRDYMGTTYCRCLYYSTHHTVDDLANFMREIHVNPSAPIYCDSASPERINLLYKYGFTGAVKALSKDIDAGITCLQSRSIVIDVAGPYGAVFSFELGGYTYMPDPMDSSKFLEHQVIDINNHAMDAMRYAIFSHFLYGREFSVGSFSTLDMASELNQMSRSKEFTLPNGSIPNENR